ncbi:hypothetical protein M407DRAFT_24150 [Tulasnella calospora MUT 4182]|uniref:Uncharacterized protein n=1 Tax=Tulasnella calospora MUT 4182 TaxID=1051891 RepID=A0A0C3QJW7_9AGAM|nr:hypothetical protein M407DRAFT_24150 [Tulasnella calospora MUT 4182]
MADQLPTPNADGIQSTTATSTNGVPFEHGVQITENSTERKSEAATGEKGQGVVADGTRTRVNWPVGDETWKEVTGVPGITRYRLYAYSGPIHFQYQLDFTNSEAWGFKFWDEAGDVYRASTFINGDHSLKFNSAQPTIVIVEAEEP